jgi:predicted molibdopterin-dependent oxidoreductase YjgC
MDKKHEFLIQVDGEKIKAVEGQTIAAAILSSGRVGFRKTKTKRMRGPYCGMGVCYECRMTVNGVENFRTCVTKAEPGCIVETQDDTLLLGDKNEKG